MTHNVFIYIACMAGVTFLIRVLPLTLMRKEIKNVTVRSFLYYVPYTVLAVMTVPAIFYATGSFYSAIAGAAVAIALALFDRGLLTVAAGSVVTVFIAELILRYI